MRELADKVWANGAFQAAAIALQRAWITREIGVVADPPPLDIAIKVMQAAAILAGTRIPDYRQFAYRCATAAFDLYGATDTPLDQAARVVLARLGNFPAMQTRAPIRDAFPALPPSLIAEELYVADRRTIVRGGRALRLTDYQFRLWRELIAGKRLAVAAPTSAGKSFVLQTFLASLFDDETRRVVAYVVPTRALITQVSTDVRRRFDQDARKRPAPIDVVTVPIEVGQALPTRAVYVMTQERLRMMLGAHPGFAPSVIIVDEAHAVEGGARGVLLQWVVDDLLRRRPQAQLLFASPGISNLDVFERMFGITDITHLRGQEPTVAQNFLTVTIEDSESGRVVVNHLEPGGTPHRIAEIALDHRSVTRIERLVNVATTLGEGASNIVYANGPGDAEQIALEIAERLNRQPTPNRLALAQLAAETVHRSYALAACARKGVAFHYSNMPTQVRQAVEQAVADGDVDYLVCTTTLLQGVNLPAKNLFLCKPEKGDHQPLESVDFWNLAGRAGRLLKEFQGNIFLIDYPNWRKKPLEQPREAPVVPAIEDGILQRRRDLLRAIEHSGPEREGGGPVDAVFNRLFNEHLNGALDDMLARIPGIELAGDDALALKKALKTASSSIVLPAAVLRLSPNISPHRQQALYDALKAIALGAADAPLSLIPRHPGDRGAFDSYVDILELCHRLILGLPETSRLHRFLALISVFWMRGQPLPQIIYNQLRRNPDIDPRKVVRDTLELVEKRVRYQCLRLFSCYGAVLVEVLRDIGREDLAESLPSIPLFLEVGASDQTTLSLMGMGLMRATATRITPLAPRRDLNAADTATWLMGTDPGTFRLSPLMTREVEELRENLILSSITASEP
jgi:hypothetical protein